MAKRSDEANKFKGKIALDLFGGVGRVARRWQRQGLAAASIDVSARSGLGFDLTEPSIQAVIFGYIRARRVLCVCMGPPCASWTRARRGPIDRPGPPPPLRTTAEPMGRSGLSDKDRAKVKIGNATLLFCCKVAELCLITGTPRLMENPLTSWMWSAPAVKRLMSHPVAGVSDTHQCQYGVRWKKPARLLHLFISPLLRPALEKRCLGRGICSRTNRPHIVLTGKDQNSGCFWTALATSYPKTFADTIADTLAGAMENRAMVKYKQLCG